MIFDDQCKLAVDPRDQARHAITGLHMRQGQISRAQDAEQVKLAASLVSPLPLYFATCG